MPSFILYLLKLSISLSAVYLFYYLLLRKLTFYNWNRLYFLIYTLLSFFIAFINVSPVIQQNNWVQTKWVRQLPAIPNHAAVTSDVITNTSIQQPINWWQVLICIFGTGVIVMIVRLIFRLISFGRLLRKAELLSDGNPKLYEVRDLVSPFSFGNAVFINYNNHSSEELENIIHHELVHVKQKHSIDILWSELLCIINWYNPLAWLLRKAMRQNLEFIADDEVLQGGIDRKEYQYLLLKVMGNPQFSIAMPFSFSSLKKRITMMNKIKSAKLQLTKFLFVLPLIVVLLLAFRETDMKQHELKYATIVYDAETLKPVPGVTIKNIYTGVSFTTDENGYAEIPIAVDDANKLHAGFDFIKEGYIKWWNRKFEFDYKKQAPRSLIELIGIKRGKANEICNSCLATMVEHDRSFALIEQTSAFYNNFISTKKANALAPAGSSIAGEVFLKQDSIPASGKNVKTIDSDKTITDTVQYSNDKAVYDTLMFVADTIVWNNETKELFVAGNASFETRGKKNQLHGYNIDKLTIDTKANVAANMIVFNGKELNLTDKHSFVTDKPGTAFQVYRLSKEEAAKQYGAQAKGKEVLIINTVSANKESNSAN